MANRLVSRMLFGAVLAIQGLGTMACVARPAAIDESSAPSIVVLGSAQDGGYPQIGCERACCDKVRADPSRRRFVSSLLIVDPRSGKRWLIDATPDLREQMAMVAGVPETRAVDGPRPPLCEGIFLTHAHVGHYAGLIHLGREIYAADRVPVYASARFRRFLATEGPWSLLVSAKHIELMPLEPGVPVELAPDLSIEPFLVPHRDEFSDTFGFLIRGPRRRVLFIPDIDKWEQWDRSLEAELLGVDVALLDGTFFEDGEVPGRAMAQVPHPFITETLNRLAPLAETEREKVLFIHLNHTNPALDPASGAAAEIRATGAGVASDGQRIGL